MGFEVTTAIPDAGHVYELRRAIAELRKLLEPLRQSVEPRRIAIALTKLEECELFVEAAVPAMLNSGYDEPRGAP